METTTTRTRPRTTGRDRESAREPDALGPREEQLDLLTAALIGVAIGCGVTLLLRSGPKGRPITPLVRAAGRGARYAGTQGARYGARGARWMADQGGDLWDRVPVDDIRESVGDYLGAAQEAINDAVESELKDLRKAIRRQRKRLGL